METVELEPQVLANRLGVTFSLVRQNRPIECMITITALEAYFWLARAGDERIRAIAERKLLAHPAARLELTPADFSRP
jgi:hypothetical protein